MSEGRERPCGEICLVQFDDLLLMLGGKAFQG
jgi:hypothetical protein